MATTTTQAQGLVLALFGASAGGHLTGLAAASSLQSLAGDLSTSAGMILGKDLSSNTAFRNHVTSNLKLTGDALTAANAWLDGQLNAGAARGDTLAAAVTFLSTLTDTTSPFYASAQAFQATVTAAVAWSSGAGATEFSVTALRAQQGNVVAGQSYTLTTGADNFFGTAGNDTFTATVASTGSTLTAGDIIGDSSSTDNDSLNISSTSSSIDTSAATIVGVENVNASFTTFGTGTVNAGGVKTGTLTLSQLQPGANGNATANGTVGSLMIKAGAGVIGTLTVDNITAGSAVVVDAGSAATVTTTTAGAKGSMTISGGAKTGTATAVADTIKVTVSKAAATVNIDGVTASKGAATVVFGESATIANGAATAVDTLDISSSFPATSSKTGTATLTTAAAVTSVNFSGSNDQVLAGSSALFTGKKITDTSSAKSTLNLTTLAADADLSKVAVDFIKVSDDDATQRTITLADKATINIAKDNGANGLIIDADDGVATTYLKGTLNLELSADATTSTLTVDGSGTTDDGFDTINLSVTADQSGLDLVTGSGVVVATGAKALVLGAAATAKSLDASAMTGDVTVNFDNTSDIVTVTTGAGADTFTNATTAIGTKVTINSGAGNDAFTMLTGAKAAINGGDGYDKVTLVGDITSLTMSNVEELAMSSAVTSAKTSQLNGKEMIISGATTFTFGTAASNFDTDSIDLSKLTINDATGFTVDVSNGLAAANYTSVTPVTVTGSSIADIIKGTANGDTLNGGAGNDTITGNNGADTINGGSGTDLIYGDNGGTKAVAQFIITTAGATTSAANIAGKKIVLNILGTDVETTFAATDTTAALQAAAINAAINANTALTNLVSSSVSTATITLTSKVDGNPFGVDLTGDADATAISIKVVGALDTAMVIGNGTTTQTVTTSAAALVDALVVANSVEGVAGTAALDTLIGGTGTDTFVFSNGNAGAAPSDVKFDTITDFATNSDVITYAANTLTIQTQTSAATSGTAKITSAGVATFHADDNTLAKKIVAVEAAIQSGTATAGQMAFFQEGADAYVFISEGTDGVDSGDVLIKLVGVDTTATAFDTATITGHSFVLA